MAPQPTNRSTVGFAKETTKGTGVAPTDFVVCELEPTPKVTQLRDMGWVGSQVVSRASQQGKRYHELKFKGDLFVDTFGFFLKSILGDETLTGSGAPYTHAFSVLNSGDGQPPAFSVTDFYVASQKIYAYTMTSELKISLDPDGAVTYEATASSFYGTTPSAPTASFTSIKPMQGWRAVALINNTSSQLVKADVSIKRKITVIPGTNNSQNPYAIWGGEVDVDAAITGIFESDTWLTDLAADTQGIFDLTFDRIPGAASTEEKLQLRCTNAAYGDVGIRRGDDYITAEVPLSANGNATDAGTSGGISPIKATLLNARSTAF